MNGPGKTFTAQVGVVGGGIAGMIAANRAALRGCDVVIFEQGREELYLCNSRFTGGVFHVAFHQPMRPADDLLRIITQATNDEADPDLARAVAEGIGPAVRWLQEEGIRFIKAGRAEWQDWILSPPQFPRAGLHWPGRGGDVLLRTMESNLNRRGGRIERGAKVTGVVRHDSGGYELLIDGRPDLGKVVVGALVLADGGYQNNPELLEQLVTNDAKALRQRGAGTGRGFGYRIAESLGAAVVNSGEFYGHVLSQDALTNDNLWPYPWIDELSGAGIVLDVHNRRFVDEGRGGVSVANALAKLDDPLGAVAIFDETTWQEVGTDMIVPANPLLEVHGCTIETSDTIEGLARKLGRDPAAFSKAVADYNSALSNNRLKQLSPPRNQKKFRSRPIIAAPYRAIRICAGITYTMGGVAIDGSSHVLDPHRQPIAGLYAAGATTGGLEGGSSVGYVGGLVKSAVSGMRAGDNAALDILGGRVVA